MQGYSRGASLHSSVQMGTDGFNAEDFNAGESCISDSGERGGGGGRVLL